MSAVIRGKILLELRDRETLAMLVLRETPYGLHVYTEPKGAHVNLDREQAEALGAFVASVFDPA